MVSPASATPTDAFSVQNLLEAVWTLENGLSALPTAVDAEYYAALQQALDRHLPRLYATYDAYVAAHLSDTARTVRCGRGCDACCRHFVDSVEPFEIAAIHLHIRQRESYPDMILGFHRRASLFQRLRQEEAARVDSETADDRALYRYYVRGAPCPFLQSDGACGIYAHRPMSCRMFFSASAPRFCRGAAIASPWNRNFQVELPDEVERALLHASRRLRALEFSEGLFPGLLEANERFGRWDTTDAPCVA